MLQCDIFPLPPAPSMPVSSRPGSLPPAPTDSPSDASSDPGPVTRLLLRWREGDEEALEAVAPLIYDELRRRARHHMRREREGHVLQTTALVHEAFLRLADLEMEWRDRVHFFAVASRLMRRVLVDFARRRKAEKRGGDAPVLSLDEALVADGPAAPAVDVLAVDRALDSLAQVDERKVRVVEMRCFAGMTIDETVEALGVSHATVERDLSFARAFLARRLGVGAG